MSNVAVFVFLLESLPGFENILNTTFQNIQNVEFKSVSQCNPITAHQIWQKVNENKNDYQIQNLINEYDENEELFNKSSMEIQNNYLHNKIDKHLEDNNEMKKDNEDVSENAPFLIAMFETFLNMTAQTCGGTLISSQWMLTAASCVDLLFYFHNNMTSAYKSNYSIIAKAKNPLIDGTVHNVTQIFLNSKLINRHNLIKHANHTKLYQRKIPTLALMKIEPTVKITPMQMFKSKMKQGLDVKVYGWMIAKNSTGQEVMSITSFEAKSVNLSKCNLKYYDYFEKKDIICFMAKNQKDINIRQITSGGPVFISQEGSLQMLGVAQLDSRSHFVAYTLSPHYDWIYNIINENN